MCSKECRGLLEIVACKLMVSDNILSRNCPNLLHFRIKYAEKGRVKGSNIKKYMKEGRKRP
jgi:hypothetical protein